jgi:hypothetical protein
MGEAARPHYVMPTILALESVLEEVSFEFQHGTGTKAADVFLKQIDVAKQGSPL